MPVSSFHSACLIDRGGRVLLEMVFQARAMPHQRAFRAVEVDSFKLLNTPPLIVAQVAAQSVAGDPTQAANLLMRQLLTLQVDSVHLALHARVRMRITLIVQGFDIRFTEFYF